MPFWELDSSAPIIEPTRVLAYYRDLMGGENTGLPPTLVATFQVRALDHLARSIGESPPIRWPTPVLWPLARGSHGGKPLAVARLPVGAPGATMALELMIAAGVRDIVLVGAAGSLQPDLAVGSLVVPTVAIRHEGTSHHYLPPGEPAVAAPEVVDSLVAAASRMGFDLLALGTTWTTDAPYRECRGTVNHLRETGVSVVEMEAAALYAVAQHRGVRTALIAAVSDQLGDPWTPGFHSLAFRKGLIRAADIALDAAVHLPPAGP